MAQLSDLVRVVAAASGMEEVQVGWIARHLREAGLIAQGGRGRGGAKMTARDATNLLIGLCSVGSAKEIPSEVHRLRQAICVKVECSLSNEMQSAFAESESLGAAFEFMMAVPRFSDDILSKLAWDVFIPTRLSDGFRERVRRLPLLVTSSISFYHPSGRVEFDIEDNDGLYVREDPLEVVPKILLNATFFAERPPAAAGDRVVKTSISLSTILEAGIVLAS